MKRTLLHKVTYKTVRFLLMPLIKYAFRFEFEKIQPKNKSYIVLANHTTNWDPILVGMSFPRHMYFVASEHLFRKGFLSKLMITFVSPIMRVKARTEVRTAIEILKTLKSGNNVCMFAEGSSSWNGETGIITDATIKLIKRCGVPLITYRLMGGYLTMPRWAKTIRFGKIIGNIVHEYSQDELSRMTEEEIGKAVYQDLYVNAYTNNEKTEIKYNGKRLAENLETVLFVCPSCKEIATLKSSNDVLDCNCGISVRYNSYGFFESITSTDPPFRTILDWDKWQRSFIHEKKEYFKSLPTNLPILTDHDQYLYSYEVGGSTTLVRHGVLSLYSDRLVLLDTKTGESTVFPLSEITDMALMVQTLLTFTVGSKHYYEVRTNYPRSSLKYLMLCKCLTDIRTMV